LYHPQGRYRWRFNPRSRAVCGEDADFANPIEPSVQGGSKIAAAITSAVTQPDFGLSRCVIFTR
jgi:hypothetical protein